MKRKTGVAESDAAVRIKEYVAGMDCTVNEPSTVQGSEPCEHSFRERSDLPGRQRPHRDEAAEARAWIEGANHGHRVSVHGNTDYMH